MRRLVITLCIGVFILCAADSALARRHTPAARKHQTLISQVSASSLTIEEDNGPRTFAITSFTEVILNDQKSTVDQLRKGMRVSVLLEDPTRVRQIKAWNAK